jgi:hypothetical protein
MSFSTSFRRLRVALLLAMAASLAAGCDSTSATDLPEWTPADHDHKDQPSAGQVDTSKPRPGMPDLEKHGITDVILAAWKTNCTPCHGLIGRGDGPRGAMLHPPDMTNPTWQRVALDSEMEHTIKKGKGRMPAFGQLPNETVTGLIRLIRMLGRRDEAPAASPESEGDAAPATATPTPEASSGTGASSETGRPGPAQ